MPKILEERQAFIESVIHDIKHISEEILWKSLNRKQFHDAIQHGITNLANSFNLKGLSEYRVDNFRADGRGDLIDVVWLADLRPVSVFEIDSSFRIKSIKKLLAVEVPFRFWVYYGTKDATFLIQKYDPKNIIRVVQLENIRFKKRKKHSKIL
ncbi:MAG: hypothetical protein H0Z29_10825 [Candidatus Marinimicrobia bacterium]|nr:hypothetical protein [Candidatus Neomarinimicrobiota bacterium]